MVSNNLLLILPHHSGKGLLGAPSAPSSPINAARNCLHCGNAWVLGAPMGAPLLHTSSGWDQTIDSPDTTLRQRGTCVMRARGWDTSVS
eukprot:1180283-Rhodomonas_salina.1